MKRCPYCKGELKRNVGDSLCGKCGVYWKPRTGEMMVADSNRVNWCEVPEGVLVVKGEVKV